MDCLNEDLLNVCRIRHFCNLKFKCTLIGNVNTYNSKKEKWPRRKYNLLKDVKENYTIFHCIGDNIEIISPKSSTLFWYLQNFNKKERLSMKVACTVSRTKQL